MGEPIKSTEQMRRDLPVFSRQRKFSELAEKHVSYRKAMLALAVFSLIINFAGVTVTGSNIGIISGVVTFPDIIPFILFLILLYYTALFVSFTSVEHNVYYMSTTAHIKQTYFRELGEVMLEQLQFRLKENFTSLLYLNVNKDNSEHDLFIFNITNLGEFSEALKNEIIKKARSLEFDIEEHEPPRNSIPITLGNANTRSKYFKWVYKPNEEDETFIKNHYKRIRYTDINNLVEIKIPIFVSIFALYSYALKVKFVMAFLN